MSVAIRGFLIGCALAVLGWLALPFLAALFIKGPGAFLAVVAITLIGGLMKACAAR